MLWLPQQLHVSLSLTRPLPEGDPRPDTCFALLPLVLLLLGQNPVHAIPVIQAIENDAASWLAVPPSTARFLVEAL